MIREQHFSFNLIAEEIIGIHGTALRSQRNYETLNWKNVQLFFLKNVLATYLLFLEDSQYNRLKTPTIMRQASYLLQQSLSLEYEWNNLRPIFEKHGIDCLPLKGINIRNYYPDPVLRPMCDLDILYREEQNDAMRRAMAEAGYKTRSEGIKHDHYINDVGIHIEMHREMVEAGTKYREYYRNIWNKVKLEDGYRHIYRLSPEDEYIFVIVHMKEHLIRGEAELKMVTDVYVMNRQCRLDKGYIERELREIGLYEFEKCISRLAENWFSGDCKVDEDLVDISEYLLGNQEYGVDREAYFSYETHGSKAKYFAYAVFPGLPRMQSMFPWLRKWPVLLPVAWGIRIVRASLYRRHNVENEWKTLKNINREGYIQGKELNALFRKYGLSEEQNI